MLLPKHSGVTRRSGEASAGTMIAIVAVVVLCVLVIVGSGAFMWYFWTQEPPGKAADNLAAAAKAAPPSGGLPAPVGLPKVGEPAPEIVGEDVDGKEFKLSDYRRKVIVLDFWAGW